VFDSLEAVDSHRWIPRTVDWCVRDDAFPLASQSVPFRRGTEPLRRLGLWESVHGGGETVLFAGGPVWTLEYLPPAEDTETGEMHADQPSFCRHLRLTMASLWRGRRAACRRAAARRDAPRHGPGHRRSGCRWPGATVGGAAAAGGSPGCKAARASP